MSQGLRTRVVIGSALTPRTHTPRTLQQAFGAHATYAGLMRKKRVDWDLIVGLACGAIVAALPALIYWGIL